MLATISSLDFCHKAFLLSARYMFFHWEVDGESLSILKCRQCLSQKIPIGWLSIKTKLSGIV
jgi:hypothetical protein